MWTRNRAAAGLMVLALCVPAALVAGEKIDETFQMEAGKRISLTFDDLSGDIEIEGWDQNTVHVEGSTSGRDWREGDPLDFDQNSRGLHIAPRARYHRDDKVRVRLHVRVPHDVDLRVDTATDLVVRNVEGRFDLAVGNGQVDLENVNGEGRISVANGHLTLTGCKLDAEISNVNGRLRIDSSDIQGDVSVVNSSMDVSNAPEGIQLSSTNGHIEVGHAARFVEASTTNGNIDVDELDGWIDAETTNGSVRVRLVGQPQDGRGIEIETLNGSVELEIPEDFSLAFDVRVESRGDHHTYEIDSDFPLEIDDRGGRRGDQRIQGTGNLNSGEHTVRIRATNGDVILRRLASSR